MAGTRRITGGIQCLIEGLAQRIPDARYKLNNKLLTLEFVDDRFVADISTDAQRTSISARVVVVTIPPRLVIETVGFSPPLNDSIQKWMTATPTWMAGNAKFVAIYEEPFWRADGLSGDAISRRGPLLEIHDASPSSTREGALFGFVGTPADQRHGKSSEIIDSAIRQLTALFGPKAARTKNILFEDWRKRPLPPFHRINLRHSSIRFGPAPHADAPWNGRVLFASTEAAQEFGGFLKGGAGDHRAGSARCNCQPALDEEPFASRRTLLTDGNGTGEIPFFAVTRSSQIMTVTEAALEPPHRTLTRLPFYRRLRPGKDELIVR